MYDLFFYKVGLDICWEISPRLFLQLFASHIQDSNHVLLVQQVQLVLLLIGSCLTGAVGAASYRILFS